MKPSGADLKRVLAEEAEEDLKDLWEEIGPCWAYLKPDGWRIQLHKLGEKVTLYTNKGNDNTSRFPQVANAIRKEIPLEKIILDTELVGFNKNGKHVHPSKVPSAHRHTCSILDVLYFIDKPTTDRPAQERVQYINNALISPIHGQLVIVEYIYISEFSDLNEIYQKYNSKKMEGYDGIIIKSKNSSYFDKVLKIKTFDTVDSVVVGAYIKNGIPYELLLAIRDTESNRWIPITKLPKEKADWTRIWKECKSYITSDIPEELYNPPELPDIWISPCVVVEFYTRNIRVGAQGKYLLYAEDPTNAFLRRDKGPDNSTTLKQAMIIGNINQLPSQLDFFSAI